MKKGTLTLQICGFNCFIEDIETKKQYQLHKDDIKKVELYFQTTCNLYMSLIKGREVEYELEGEFARIPSLKNNTL